MKFTYSSGQRVLDGYTLKRGIGRGGFGEVYYALSDGGKEVALKLVRGHNLEVELRGMAQCLNLKHPNLMTLIDLRTDAQGDHWVVMEYISGEPLSVVLNRHPQGLPPELVQQWFVALAKAVSCLHDHGIVHRDLKPGNIFVENGSVKVGDYGLCKFISSSQRTAQTQSVGTVHYMAPEISTGNYHKQIDIYSAGIILYDKLTGCSSWCKPTGSAGGDTRPVRPAGSFASPTGSGVVWFHGLGAGGGGIFLHAVDERQLADGFRQRERAGDQHGGQRGHGDWL